MKPRYPTIATPVEIKCLFTAVADKTDPRRYLQGVLIAATATSLHLVAANGPAIAELDHGEDHSPELAGAVAAWCRLTGNPNLIIKPWKVSARGDIALSFDGARVFAHQNGVETLLDTSLSDQGFPDWRRISVADKTTSEPLTELRINPIYLAPFSARKSFKGIKLTFPGGETSAVRVECTGDLSRVTGTVMPIRD